MVSETFYCYDNGQIELHLKFDEPAWPLLQALDYEKFTTNEEQDLLSEDVAGSELCIMNFTDYDTEGSVGHYIINVPKVEPVKRCGIVYVSIMTVYLPKCVSRISLTTWDYQKLRGLFL